MASQVSPLSDELSFGAIVTGVTMDDVNDPKAAQALKDIWIDRGVVVFREVDTSTEFQIALSKCFGKLERHPTHEIWVEGFPDLIGVVSKPDSGLIMRVEGKDYANWIPWHADTIYTTALNRGGVLRVTQKTSWGGETCFLDQIGAYDSLPEHLKQAVENIRIVYQFDSPTHSIYARRLGAEIVRSSKTFEAMMSRVETDFPPVVHPAVFVQPETGRKALALSPHFAQYIHGMDRDEGDRLLAELVDHLVSQKPYRHSWQDGELLLWDNWRVVHAVTGCPLDETRAMRRTTIMGDYVSGRKLSELEAA